MSALPDPETLVREFYHGRGYDLVLVEGYKHGPFPRVEVHRHSLHAAPLYAESPGTRPLALVTDAPAPTEAETVIPLDPSGDHVGVLADFIVARMLADAG